MTQKYKQKSQLCDCKQVKVLKFPPISQQRKRTAKSQACKNDSILKPSANRTASTNRQKSSVRFNLGSSPKEIKFRDLDNFIKKKNMQELDEAYQFKTRNLTELSLESNHRLTPESENVSEYIKTFFEQKKKDNRSANNDQNQAECKEPLLTNRNSKRSGRMTKNSGRRNSIYMKKLNNNFYEKKLLFGLGIKDNKSNKFNIYSDKFIRNYNNQFSILTSRHESSLKIIDENCIFI